MGTPRRSSLEKTRGALPSRAISNNIRVDEYMPELPADIIAVKITAFIKPAANAKPAFSYNRVNGDRVMFPSPSAASARFGSVYATNVPMIKIHKI
ncbi:hypothetical protein D3C75_1093330 [compost metagenome]